MRRWRSACSVIVAGAIAIGSVSIGAAQSEGAPSAGTAPITLRWRAPASCPDEVTVRRRIDDLVAGASVGRSLAADVTVREEPSGRFRVDMRLTDDRGGGERSLEGATCEEIAEATALVVALAYDPEAVAANQARDAGGGEPGGEGGSAEPEPRILPLPPVVPTAPPTARFVPPPPPAPPPPPVMPPVPVTPSRVASMRVFGSPVVGVELGALPGPATVVGGELGVRIDPFDIRARGLFALPVRETLTTRDAGGDFDRWTVGPALCLAPWRTRRATVGDIGGLRLGACLALELGQMRGRGFGVQNPDEGAALWVAPDTEGHLALTLLSWLELDVALAAIIPLRRPDFILNQVGIVHRASPITGRATAALTLVLP